MTRPKYDEDPSYDIDEKSWATKGFRRKNDLLIREVFNFLNWQFLINLNSNGIK